MIDHEKKKGGKESLPLGRTGKHDQLRRKRVYGNQTKGARMILVMNSDIDDHQITKKKETNMGKVPKEHKKDKNIYLKGLEETRKGRKKKKK